ncbi:MraY family glycosyltransferase [Spirosoma aerophilum]
MSLTAYLLLTIFLVGAEWLYIRLARRAGWYDAPNARSSHEKATIVRAGGFIIYLAAMGSCWLGKADTSLFGFGLTILALVSFRDDFVSVPKRYRLAVHLLAVGLFLMQERLVPGQWYGVAGLLFVGVGIVNAYNFMDGINGITALNSLLTIGTFWYWGAWSSEETDPLWPTVFIALLIFSYVNVRRQAICFAGDVGSISIGFIVLYGLMEAILRGHTYLPLLCLSVYGVDTAGTIIYRLYHRQPIFRAHRLHLFQQLVHEAGWPHLRVSALYTIVQAVINLLVITAMDWLPLKQLALAVSLLSVLMGIYGWARHRINRARQKAGFEKLSSPSSTNAPAPIG